MANTTTKKPGSTPTLTEDAWNALGVKLYGDDRMQWRFVCPICKHEATVQDWKDAGAPEGSIAFACVGRWRDGRDAFGGEGPGPCNYTGGGLFSLNPIDIVRPNGGTTSVFNFAGLPFPLPQGDTTDETL